MIAATGYKTLALYDVTTLDWNSDHDAQYILNGVLKQTTNGSVILLHMLDGLHTLEALPKVIDQLKQRGYSFVLLDEPVRDEIRNERLLGIFGYSSGNEWG